MYNTGHGSFQYSISSLHKAVKTETSNTVKNPAQAAAKMFATVSRSSASLKPMIVAASVNTGRCLMAQTVYRARNVGVGTRWAYLDG